MFKGIVKKETIETVIECFIFMYATRGYLEISDRAAKDLTKKIYDTLKLNKGD